MLTPKRFTLLNPMVPAPKKFTLLNLSFLVPKRFTLLDLRVPVPKRFILLEILTFIFLVLILPTSRAILDIWKKYILKVYTSSASF